MKSRQRYWREILPVKLRFWVSGRAVEAWSESTDLFFILGSGRSGTTFLANLLNKATEAHVVHEPIRADFVAYRHAFHDANAAERYVKQFRKKEMYLRAHGRPHTVYGEVNSLLRRHASALQQAFPDATLLHLVRDGRDVVRSMMARRTLLPDDPGTIGIRPTESDRWAEEWEEMNRFARLCWYWQVDNAYLRQTIGQTKQFEKILESYDYFNSEILVPCGLTISHSLWQEAVKNPSNATEQHQLPSWGAWSEAQQRIFLRICGNEMRKCGYKV